MDNKMVDGKGFDVALQVYESFYVLSVKELPIACLQLPTVSSWSVRWVFTV